MKRIVATVILYILALLSLTVLIVMWSNECLDDLNKQFRIMYCSGSETCIDFLSTYLVMCKYSAHHHGFLAWILYYCIVVSVILHHFVVVHLVRLEYFWQITILSLIQFIAISLVWMFDSTDIEGTYYAYNQSYQFAGFSTSPVGFHRAGVVIFLTASLFINLLLLNKLFRAPRALRMWPNLRRVILYEECADFLYMLAIALFVGCFLLDLLQPAIILEYIVIFSYFAMICITLYFFWVLPTDQIQDSSIHNA